MRKLITTLALLAAFAVPASAQTPPTQDACGFYTGRALQNADGTPGYDLICITEPGVYYTYGVSPSESGDHVRVIVAGVTIRADYTREGAVVDVIPNGDYRLYVQSLADGTTVYGSDAADYLIAYAGTGQRLVGKDGHDAITATDRDAEVTLNGGSGRDNLSAFDGVVRGGTGRDTCDITRDVRTRSCEIKK